MVSVGKPCVGPHQLQEQTLSHARQFVKFRFHVPFPATTPDLAPTTDTLIPANNGSRHLVGLPEDCTPRHKMEHCPNAARVLLTRLDRIAFYAVY